MDKKEKFELALNYLLNEATLEDACAFASAIENYLTEKGVSINREEKAAAEVAVVEQSEFKVFIESLGEASSAAKIAAIKALRQIDSNLNLREAKAKIDSVATEPLLIGEQLTKEEAEERKKIFADSNAVITIK